ncbi:uncharacterized protein LOC108864931 [Galendromus occidentalis]|uniref:Uncharacterized protein LOC108864931 n=1 Tax=Galendromus occidentalis TaxID=34638 RepID=A0AAJ7L742_9ACAR|nr:uncharacterized protein LOC108864931 [Galendromus occidentalis]
MGYQQRNAQPESFWRSPCGASTIGPLAETPDWGKLHNLLSEISMRAEMTSREAEQKKKQFLEGTYNDSLYEDIYRSTRHNWLPRPPRESEYEDDFNNTNIETAFRRVYGYLQHYAVGLEQATLDQVFAHEGKFANLFREIQYSLRLFLCDFDMSISLLRIKKDPDVLRDVMSVEQRKPIGEHKITLRDYMILRDYIDMVSYVSKLFAFLAKHPEKSPALVLRETPVDEGSAFSSLL